MTIASVLSSVSSVSPGKSSSLRVVSGTPNTVLICAKNLYGLKERIYLCKSENKNGLPVKQVKSYYLKPKGKLLKH
jgi:hypothetical protein